MAGKGVNVIGEGLGQIEVPGTAQILARDVLFTRVTGQRTGLGGCGRGTHVGATRGPADLHGISDNRSLAGSVTGHWGS